MKPYKGPDSYQVEDAELFFGRDHEAKQLAAHILSRRFTLLHAPSGAGKTSLLNAKIIPNLERGGWFAVRMLPQNNPIASVRATTLQYLIPPLETELRVLDASVAALAEQDEDLPLNDLLARFAAMSVRNPLKRELIEPVKVADSPNPAIFPKTVRVTPFFGRLLRSSIKMRTFANHLLTLQQFIDTTEPTRITDHTPVSNVRQLLSDRALAASYQVMLQVLDIPVAGLWAFFENLVEIYGRGHPRFGLVLILDQFEELFTRFIDTGKFEDTDLPSYQLREDFIEEFRELYTRGLAETDPTYDAKETADENRNDEFDDELEEDATYLPIRFVISMRDEYIARLIDRIRYFVGSVDEASFHLNALRRKAAREAIQEPAAVYQYAYADETYEAIIDNLTHEKRFVEPTHLQIVCEKLWDIEGKELSLEASNSPTSVLLEIAKDTLDELGGIQEILKSFFRDFLNKKLIDERERQEALEMLKPLITAADTRNIVERDQLIEVPFRKNQLRKKLLGKLESGRIVRTEQRLGGHFVEITHEFLIEPIQESIQKHLTLNADYNLFRAALRELERSEYVDFRAGAQHLLSEKSVGVLYEHVGRVEWPDWGKELMFRSAAVHHVEPVIESLARAFEKTPRVQEAPEAPEMREAPEASESSYARALLAKMDKYEQKRRTLSLGQLQYLNNLRDDFEPYSVRQLIHIVRSELNQANDTERDDIVFWTEKLVEALDRTDLDESTEA